MRKGPVEGEYPVLYVGAGNLGYEDAVMVASSFVEAWNVSTTSTRSARFFSTVPVTARGYRESVNR